MYGFDGDYGFVVDVIDMIGGSVVVLVVSWGVWCEASIYSSKFRRVGVFWCKWNYDSGDMGVFIIVGVVVDGDVTAGMIVEVWYESRSVEVVGYDMMVLVCGSEYLYVGDVMILRLVISEAVLYILYAFFPMKNSS